ncbi:MAG: hypothetical protein JW884_03205 [Deltaproteobacteria bacterium]|nr:hypothetical protein [Deltaproteobacteria bacterium]
MNFPCCCRYTNAKTRLSLACTANNAKRLKVNVPLESKDLQWKPDPDGMS